jgi:hypothetical protein
MNTVMIGAVREGKLPSLVLEHSIRRHSSSSIQVLHTWDKKFPNGSRKETRSRSGGFTFNRFGVPKMGGYQGVGIYLDCDMLLMADIAELEDLSKPELPPVLRPVNQTSVLVLDNSRLSWDVEKIVKDLDAGVYSYQDLMEYICIERPENIGLLVPAEWNSLEAYQPKVTKNLHYTNMITQPWRKWGHPLGALWLAELESALMAGRVTLDVVREEVEKGYVVPQVLEAVA